MDKQMVVDAINYLIKSDNYVRLSKLIIEIIDNWEFQPMVFADRLTILNSLINIGLDNRAALDRLLTLAEEKRRVVPKLKRADYQRNLMRERRIRLHKVIALEQSKRGRPLTPAEKERRTTQAAATWSKEKDKFIKAKGKLSWFERNEAIEEFWKMVDFKLDTNLATEGVDDSALARPRGRPKAANAGK